MKQNTFTRLLLVGFGGLVLSARAAIPADYVELESIVVPKGTSLDVGTDPTETTKVSVDVIVGEAERELKDVPTRLVTFDQIARCFGGEVTSDGNTNKLTACVKVVSGDFGLYDEKQKDFFRLVPPEDEQSKTLVEDTNTLNRAYIDPGQVLKHNYRYLVTEDRLVDATSMPGLSAIRVPNGAAAIIDIAEGKTLTVKGGPGFGRLPGGAGIEVPHGAKLVITGKQGSKLVVQGGAAAAGGKGYGGMGGQFSFFQMTGELDPKHWPYEDFDPGSYTDITNNNVAASSFAKDPLYFGLTGDGGDGGDGGGGAGAGIGTRGGAGGLGGKGPLATFVTGGPFYDEEEEQNRYKNYADFFGLKQSDWYIYNKEGNFAHNGRDGFAGNDGQSAATCGEIIIAGDVTVEATAGAAGVGGENGPFGACAQMNEKTYEDHSSMIDSMNVLGTTVGVLGTLLGDVAGEGIAEDIAFAMGAGSAAIALGLVVAQIANGDDSILQTQLWFTGGGGGGGGGGGFGGYGIGAGGAGGGGGGAGGEGFFELGVKSLYTFTGSWLSWKVDGTTPPLAVSGHGGFGGMGAENGKDASSHNRGEAESHAKGSEDVYNYLQIPGGEWRLGADSWRDGVEAFSGLGGAGGNQAEVNTNSFSFFCVDVSKVSGYDANVVTPGTLKSTQDVCTITFHMGGEAADEKRDFICGTIVEQAPTATNTMKDKDFVGYFTQENGQGTQFFDSYRNPVCEPKALGDFELYAYWVEGGQGPKGFENEVNGSELKVGDALQNETIYRFTENCDFVNENGPGLSVPSGATTVLYLEKDVVVNLKGSDANGTEPGQPGIAVPSDATLIVTGEGKLIANGGKAADGGNGVDDQYLNALIDVDAARGYAGQGGIGGAGGGGAAPGIGGAGGVGGAGGDGAKTVWHDCSNTDFMTDGSAGAGGGAGTDGQACGSVYLLGSICVDAKSGEGGTGGAGGSYGNFSYYQWANHYIAAGGGGAGGGGAGGVPGAGIGGGGAGGGGGGGGGAGFTQYEMQPGGWPDARDSGLGITGKAGAGGGGGGADGKCGHYNELEGRSGEIKRGGGGGAGGAAGTAGANGSLYINDEVVLNAELLSERGGDFSYSFGHPALGRTMTIRRDGAEDLPVPALIGCPLPVLAADLIRPQPGVVLKGAYVVDAKSGEMNTNDCWYAEKGAPAIPQYRGLDNVTLKVVYAPDTERIAAAPEVFNFRYDGENHVAYNAENLPGSTYLCGVTNATETGVYSYSLRLDDDYTIWSDLATNRVKTIGWEVTRGVITNDWSNNVLTYDWTKSRADNIFALTNNPATTFGFELPEDAKVSFTLGEQTQVNEQRLIAKIDGMKNYFDKTYYGVFSCEQPFQLMLRPHYPWAAKLDILTMLSSVKIPEEDMEAFRQTYGNTKILAYIYVPDGEGGTRAICLNEDSAATVRDALDSGSRTACVTVDLKSIPELKGVREYSLPVYVSLDGQVFQGGSTTVDTTAEDSTGYPVYTVNDVADIFDIACSTTFIDGSQTPEDSVNLQTLLAIGTPDKPGSPFTPRTASGNPITDDYVRWKPTSAGTYRLEHWVADPAETEPIGYRRADFNFTGVGPESDPSDIVRVKIERKVSGETKGYTSLAAAVADLRYGDTLVIVKDVQMEQVKVPSGTRVRVEEDGVFRVPQAGDLPSDYIAADTVIDPNGKLVSAAYHLDEEKVKPVIIAANVVEDEEEGRVFDLTVDNVKGDLFYLLNGSTDLVSWALKEKCFANGQTGRADLVTPATDAQGFYKLAVTDEPTPKFMTKEVLGGVGITGSESFTTGAPFAGRLVIPSAVEGKTVKEISENAFADRTDITSVDIAEGIGELARGAFNGCVGLKSLVLPKSLSIVRADALSAASLETLIVPENVETLETQNWPALKFLRFLGKPSTIGGLQLSSDCVVYVPQDAGWEGVPSEDWNGARLEYWVDFTLGRDDAGNTIVAGCDRVPLSGRLWIPSERDGRKIAAVKYEAFRDREDITKLVVSEGVSDVGGGSFLGCTNLTEVEFPKSLTHLGRNIFGDKSSKSNVTSVTFLGDSPTYDADIGLDGTKCTVYVRADAKGWGATWQGCPVVKR